MNVSTKVAGLVTAGAVTAGVVAVATMSSSSANRTVSANSPLRTSRPPAVAAAPAPAGLMCRYNVVGGRSLAVMSGHRRIGSLGRSARNVPGSCLPAGGQVIVQAANGKTGWVGARHLSRQTIVVFLSTRYAVQGVRRGHTLAVWTKTGMKWRVAGTLRWNDRHVTAAAMMLHQTRTVVVVVGHRLVSVVVPAGSDIVIADNGRLGIVKSRNLTRSRMPMPTPSSSPTAPVLPSPSPTAVTPSPTGSQAPIINGLAPRHSTKW